MGYDFLCFPSTFWSGFPRFSLRFFRGLGGPEARGQEARLGLGLDAVRCSAGFGVWSVGLRVTSGVFRFLDLVYPRSFMVGCKGLRWGWFEMGVVCHFLLAWFEMGGRTPPKVLKVGLLLASLLM